MYIYICMHTCILYLGMCVCIYESLAVSMYVHTNLRRLVSICVCMYAYM